ncbi:hypothetical protein LguiB_026566 [Lonicera macranthoides]
MDFLCYCGDAVVTRTSTTSKNPGCHFLTYPNGPNVGCGFFIWEDVAIWIHRNRRFKRQDKLLWF